MDERHVLSPQYSKSALPTVGVDEAGRGPLAGPLAVGAVAIYDTAALRALVGTGLVRDSKLLSEKQRGEIFARMTEYREVGSLGFSVTLVGPAMIDRIGIAASARRGVARALRALSLDPLSCEVRLDGSLFAPRRYVHQTTIIRGDRLEPVISLASIAAKETRDAYMRRLARRYPQYGFERHKGYGTAAHYDAIEAHGCALSHRRTFLKNFFVGTIVSNEGRDTR